MELYDRLVATNSAVERKGAAMPYTSRNGHMFSFVTKEGVVALRLPEAARKAFVKKYKTQPLVQHAAVLEEYVQVPKALLEDTRKLEACFEEAYAYVGSLKPKPTRK